MTDFVLYGGKGGVGKTTVAAASGLRQARTGHETLVVSTDPAHSLTDSVGVELGADPTEITDGLFGVEVDPQRGVDRYLTLFEALARLREGFPNLALWTVPDQSGEVTGLDALEGVGAHFGGRI